jgi:hypothetical protein
MSNASDSGTRIKPASILYSVMVVLRSFKHAHAARWITFLKLVVNLS